MTTTPEVLLKYKKSNKPSKMADKPASRALNYKQKTLPWNRYLIQQIKQLLSIHKINQAQNTLYRQAVPIIPEVLFFQANRSTNNIFKVKDGWRRGVFSKAYSTVFCSPSHSRYLRLFINMTDVLWMRKPLPRVLSLLSPELELRRRTETFFACALWHVSSAEETTEYLLLSFFFQRTRRHRSPKTTKNISTQSFSICLPSYYHHIVKLRVGP